MVSSYTYLPILCMRCRAEPGLQESFGGSVTTEPFLSGVLSFPFHFQEPLLPVLLLLKDTVPVLTSRRIETCIVLELTSALCFAEIPSQESTRLGFLIEMRGRENPEKSKSTVYNFRLSPHCGDEIPTLLNIEGHTSLHFSRTSFL